MCEISTLRKSLQVQGQRQTWRWGWGLDDGTRRVWPMNTGGVLSVTCDPGHSKGTGLLPGRRHEPGGWWMPLVPETRRIPVTLVTARRRQPRLAVGLQDRPPPVLPAPSGGAGSRMAQREEAVLSRPPCPAARRAAVPHQSCCYRETRAVLCSVTTAPGQEALPLSGAGAVGRLSWLELSHSFFTRTYSLIATWAS